MTPAQEAERTAPVDYDPFLVCYLGLILHSITFWGILAYYGAIGYALGMVGLL